MGVRLYETTHFSKGQEENVEALIVELTHSIYNAKRHQVRPKVTFQDCAIEYLSRNQNQLQIKGFEGYLKRIDEFIGHIEASKLHDRHPDFLRLLDQQHKRGNKKKSINHYIEAVNRVLSAAAKWRYDWCELTWLAAAPKFELLTIDDKRPSHPLSWAEQEHLLKYLPHHIQDEVISFINSGLRDSELYDLQWKNELDLPNGIMGFITRNKGTRKRKFREKLILCNEHMREVIERKRGEHLTHVFSYKGNPKKSGRGTGWRSGVKASGLDLTIHDLRHTFGHRLRAAGVDEETRKELLGHGVSLTSMYSASAIETLYEAVCLIDKRTDYAPVIDLMKYKKSLQGSRETHEASSEISH
jgi:integrase